MGQNGEGGLLESEVPDDEAALAGVGLVAREGVGPRTNHKVELLQRYQAHELMISLVTYGGSDLRGWVSEVTPGPGGFVKLDRVDQGRRTKVRPINVFLDAIEVIAEQE